MCCTLSALGHLVLLESVLMTQNPLEVDSNLSADGV